jgi:hypothetical protein
VDHSARHYINNNPSRYALPSRVGINPNYGPTTDYDYLGYDRSYSTSYSTAEQFQQQQQQQQQQAGGYHNQQQQQQQQQQPQQYYPSIIGVHQQQQPQVYQMAYNGQQQQQPQQQYGQQMQPQYGYRPIMANANGNNSGGAPAAFAQAQIMPSQAQMYQRQY